jgi:hypothetical protein
MPSHEEMLEELDVLASALQVLPKRNQDVFSDLRDRLGDLSELRSPEEKFVRDRLQLLYEDAITTLLLVADPPNAYSLQGLLADLTALTNHRIDAVSVVPPRDLVAEQGDAGAEVNRRRKAPRSVNLKTSLPRYSELTPEQVEVIRYFREQIDLGERPGPDHMPRANLDDVQFS